MSQPFIELRDRIITDTGEVVAKYPLLRKLAFDGMPVNLIQALPNEDISKYNGRTPNAQIPIYEAGEPEGPPASTYEWNIPEKYKQIDIGEECLNGLVKFKLLDQKYVDRLSVELLLMEERGMENFIRGLLYVRDQFRKYSVVLGVGRGSSASSLIMFLIEINRVDPVLYDISYEEFFKPGVEDDE